MGLPLERPSADAVKIFCHVKEWLDEDVWEEELRATDEDETGEAKQAEK